MNGKMNKGLLLWATLLGLAFPAACGSSGVVGGDCSASYVSCDGQCVDTQNDPANCGGCKRACEPGVACQNAICEGMLPGSAGNSGNGGSSGESSSGGDAGSGNGTGIAGDDDPGNLSDAHPDGDAACLPPYDRASACGDCQTTCTGGTPVCSPDGMGSYVCVPKCKGGLTDCDGQCVDPASFDSAASCGGCDRACPTSAPTCSPDGMGSHSCVLICEDPLKACNGRCVDFNIDADNCGSCGNACPTGICQAGMCVGATPGNVVAVCMDYQTAAPGTPQTVLMGNAAFLPSHRPVRILAYVEFASATTIAKVNQDLGYAAQATSSTYSLNTLAQSNRISAQLSVSKYDLFLIYDQTLAASGKLATIGAAWHASSVLDSFTAAGGTIVVLSGGTSEMDQFMSASQLLDVSAQTVVTGAKLYNRQPGNVVGHNVLSPFLAPSSSCTFTANLPADAVVVVSDAQTGPSAPTVVHRVIVQP